MQPFDYRQQVVNPFEQAIGSAVKGFQLGESIRQVREQREAATEQQARQQELMRQLEQIQQKPDRTWEDYQSLANLLPKDQAESLRKNYELLNTERQDSAKRFSGQVAAALLSPNPDAQQRGIDLLRQSAQAERNAGNVKEAEGYEIHAQIAETEGGTKIVADEIMTFGSTIFGKDWADGVLKIRETPKAGFRPITPEERERFGLPANVSFQVGPDGKIMPITKEPLVTITGPLVGAENKYAETVGTETGKEDVEAVRAATKGVGDLAKIDRTLKELYTSQAITGLGAEIFKNIERVKTLLGSDVAAGRVADTELLDALLGSDVFPQIGALGIGARGLDTPAEREFLRMVMTGTINLNRDTLIRMTEIRRNVQQRAIEQYNERVERGELDRYFEITRRQKKQFPTPPAPTPPQTGPRRGVPPYRPPAAPEQPPATQMPPGFRVRRQPE